VVGAALLAGLAGCGSGHILQPGIDMYHGLQGGAIAEQRPPPPGVDDPYPSLGSVPVRPTAPDVPAQQRIADRLATQRDDADAQAAKSPIVVTPPQPATPPKPPAPPDPNANRVVVDAAPTPPPAPAPPAPVASTSVTPPDSIPSVPDIGAVPALPAAVASGPIPTLAGAPPASPVGLGIDIPATQIAAVSAVPVAPAAAAPANMVLVVFTPGSATLPPSATLNLRRFALAHRGVGVTITGHGGDVLPGPDSQARALDLGLRRAQAIAASLGSDGIPAANLHLRGEAAGQGGSASL
jgi:outer membrane protein OmpA-like peptidoglycan-associated protein